MRRDDAGAAKEGAVAAEREQRVEARRIIEPVAAGVVVELFFLTELQVEGGSEIAERSQHRRKIAVTEVPDDAEADHPAIASLSCSARTRSAIPAASSPQAAS